MTNLCPVGSEGASFAMFTSVHNSAILVSSALTTRLLGVWDVSKEAFLLGMLDIDYSSIDSSSSYIICTPMKMKESRLPSYSMLGIRVYYNWFDSGAAMMMNVYNDFFKENATS